MTTLSLTRLTSSDTRFWVSRATALYCQATTLPTWLRVPTQLLACEVRTNLNSLRAVGPLCPIPPSLWSWVSTVALLLVVSPRLGMSAVRLFLVCHALRLEPYRAIGHGVAFVVGGAIGMSLALIGGYV